MVSEKEGVVKITYLHRNKFWKKIRVHDQKIYMDFVDILKAFGSVPREQICQSLRKRGIKMTLRNNIKAIYEVTRNVTSLVKQILSRGYAEILQLPWRPTVARNRGVRVSRGVAVSAPGMFSKRPRSNQGCEGGRSFPNQSLQDVILGSSCILTSCRLARILNLQQKWYTSRFHLRCPQTQFNMGKLEHE